MNHYVYEITNLVNGKKYIGKRSCRCDIEDDKYMGSGHYIKRAIKKYGKENFKKEIIKICESEKEAFEYEEMYIRQVKAYDDCNYYNIALGGCGFSSEQIKEMWEDEAYRKMRSNSVKSMWEDNEKRKEIIHSMKIRYATDESKLIRSNASKRNWNRKGYKEQHIKKIKERWSDNDYRNNISSIMKDKFKDEEYVNKMSKIWEKQNKKVIMLNNNKTFKNCVEASEYVGLKTSSTITLCCKGTRLSAGKIGKENAVWMYYDEYLNSNPSFINEKLANGKSSRNSSNSNLADNSIKVICLNTGEVFNSLSSAAKSVGLKTGYSIGKCCKGINHSAGKRNGEKLKWMYYDEYLKRL